MKRTALALGAVGVVAFAVASPLCAADRAGKAPIAVDSNASGSGRSPKQVAGALVGVAPLVSSAALASDGGTPLLVKQRIAIEVSWPESEKDVGRTFRLVLLGSGPLRADTGVVTGSTIEVSSVIRDGRRVATFMSVQTLTGKRGTLRIRSVDETSEAGSGYRAGAITWSVGGGTGAYLGLSGNGRGAIVITPQGPATQRYEGYVSKR